MKKRHDMFVLPRSILIGVSLGMLGGGGSSLTSSISRIPPAALRRGFGLSIIAMAKELS